MAKRKADPLAEVPAIVNMRCREIRPMLISGAPRDVDVACFNAYWTLRQMADCIRLHGDTLSCFASLTSELGERLKFAVALASGVSCSDRDAIVSACDAMLEWSKGHLPPLSPVAASVYELLLEIPPYCAATGRKIVDELNRRDPQLLIDESTFRSRIVRELRPYGLENLPRIGYRIRPDKRPAGPPKK